MIMYFKAKRATFDPSIAVVVATDHSLQYIESLIVVMASAVILGPAPVSRTFWIRPNS